MKNNISKRGKTEAVIALFSQIAFHADACGELEGLEMFPHHNSVFTASGFVVLINFI